MKKYTETKKNQMDESKNLNLDEGAMKELDAMIKQGIKDGNSENEIIANVIKSHPNLDNADGKKWLETQIGQELNEGILWADGKTIEVGQKVKALTDYTDGNIIIKAGDTGEVTYINMQGEIHTDWGENSIIVDMVDSDFHKSVGLGESINEDETVDIELYFFSKDFDKIEAAAKEAGKKLKDKYAAVRSTTTVGTPEPALTISMKDKADYNIMKDELEKAGFIGENVNEASNNLADEVALWRAENMVSWGGSGKQLKELYDTTMDNKMKIKMEELMREWGVVKDWDKFAEKLLAHENKLLSMPEEMPTFEVFLGGKPQKVNEGYKPDELKIKDFYTVTIDDRDTAQYVGKDGKMHKFVGSDGEDILLNDKQIEKFVESNKEPEEMPTFEGFQQTQVQTDEGEYREGVIVEITKKGIYKGKRGVINAVSSGDKKTYEVNLMDSNGHVIGSDWFEEKDMKVVSSLNEDINEAFAPVMITSGQYRNKYGNVKQIDDKNNKKEIEVLNNDGSVAATTWFNNTEVMVLTTGFDKVPKKNENSNESKFEYTLKADKTADQVKADLENFISQQSINVTISDVQDLGEGNFSITVDGEDSEVEKMGGTDIQKIEEADEWEKGVETLLGVNKKDIIDTWLDDEDKNKSRIASLISSKYEKGNVKKSIKNQEHQHMEYKLFDIDGIGVVMMPGQPDEMYYKKSDEKNLLDAAGKYGINETKFDDVGGFKVRIIKDPNGEEIYVAKAEDEDAIIQKDLYDKIGFFANDKEYDLSDEELYKIIFESVNEAKVGDVVTASDDLVSDIKGKIVSMAKDTVLMEVDKKEWEELFGKSKDTDWAAQGFDIKDVNFDKDKYTYVSFHTKDIKESTNEGVDPEKESIQKKISQLMKDKPAVHASVMTILGDIDDSDAMGRDNDIEEVAKKLDLDRPEIGYLKTYYKDFLKNVNEAKDYIVKKGSKVIDYKGQYTNLKKGDSYTIKRVWQDVDIDKVELEEVGGEFELANFEGLDNPITDVIYESSPEEMLVKDTGYIHDKHGLVIYKGVKGDKYEFEVDSNKQKILVDKANLRKEIVDIMDTGENVNEGDVDPHKWFAQLPDDKKEEITGLKKGADYEAWLHDAESAWYDTGDPEKEEWRNKIGESVNEATQSELWKEWDADRKTPEEETLKNIKQLMKTDKVLGDEKKELAWIEGFTGEGELAVTTLWNQINMLDESVNEEVDADAIEADLKKEFPKAGRMVISTAVNDFTDPDRKPGILSRLFAQIADDMKVEDEKGMQDIISKLFKIWNTHIKEDLNISEAEILEGSDYTKNYKELGIERLVGIQADDMLSDLKAVYNKDKFTGKEFEELWNKTHFKDDNKEAIIGLFKKDGIMEAINEDSRNYIVVSKRDRDNALAVLKDKFSGKYEVNGEFFLFQDEATAKDALAEFTNSDYEIEQQSFKMNEDSPFGDVSGDWEHSEALDYAAKLIDVYGQPDAISSESIIWNNPDDDWERIEIRDEAISHQEPEPHEDFIYGTVKLEIPDEMTDEISGISDSIIVDQLKGEVTARCGAMIKNAITVNIVKEVVDGTISPEEAVEVYPERIKSNELPDWYEDKAGDLEPPKPPPPPPEDPPEGADKPPDSKTKPPEEMNETNQHDLITLKPAEDDQEIYDRIKILKDAGIDAVSGAKNSKTDILVNRGEGERAKEIFKKAGLIVEEEMNELDKPENFNNVSDAQKAVTYMLFKNEIKDEMTPSEVSGVLEGYGYNPALDIDNAFLGLVVSELVSKGTTINEILDRAGKIDYILNNQEKVILDENQLIKEEFDGLSDYEIETMYSSIESTLKEFNDNGSETFKLAENRGDKVHYILTSQDNPLFQTFEEFPIYEDEFNSMSDTNLDILYKKVVKIEYPGLNIK